MKILLLHNRYQQSGGEDVVFAAESELLRVNGHKVVEYLDDNQRISSMGKVSLVSQTVWSRASYSKIMNLIHKERPDIVHFHNIFPLISPSAYYACNAEGIPVVQTLHNYRLLCPVATFYRKGRICEKCLGKVIPWPGVYHGCYHDSRIQTAAIAGMLTLHKIAGTWHDHVDRYIALTDFAKQKFVQGGLPAEKIVVKSNFLYPDPEKHDYQGNCAIFVGRLSSEKGISTLIEAWKNINTVPLKIAGDGPLRDKVELLARANSNVDILGELERVEILKLMKSASFLVISSECYEGFPLVIVEAFANQLPVIAPNLGSNGELIRDRVTGLYFSPGDPVDLAVKVRWAWEHPSEMAEMGRNARREYEEKFTAEKNYNFLMDIYQQTIQMKRKTG